MVLLDSNETQTKTEIGTRDLEYLCDDRLDHVWRNIQHLNFRLENKLDILLGFNGPLE